MYVCLNNRMLLRKEVGVNCVIFKNKEIENVAS